VSYLVLTEGAFGGAVAAALTAALPDVVVHPLSRLDELEPSLALVDAVLVALWRRYDRACDRVDVACRRAGVRWSQAVLHEAYLQVGPLVAPDAGPCFACYQRRALAHEPALEAEQALARAYARDPRLGVPGYLPATAALAAHLLARQATEVSAEGRLVRVHVLDGQIVDTQVVRIHGCDRCGRDGERATGGDRFVRELIPALEELR